MFRVSGQPAVEQIVKKSPEIYITPEAYFTMQQYAAQCQYEISWFSRVLNPAENQYIIVDALLLDQTVWAASAEFSPEELSKFTMDTIKQKGIDFFNQIKCWGHSHVNMATSPSGQDLQQIRTFREQDYYIMLIINKRGEAHVEFYDFKNNTVYKNLCVSLCLPNSEEIRNRVKADIERCVKTTVVKTFQHDAPYHGYGQLGMFQAEPPGILHNNGDIGDVEDEDYDIPLQEDFMLDVNDICYAVAEQYPKMPTSVIYQKLAGTLRRHQFKLDELPLRNHIQKEIAYLLQDIYDAFSEQDLTKMIQFLEEESEIQKEEEAKA